MNKIKVMVVDDHAIVRDGIRLSLEKNDTIEIIAEASNGAEALDLHKKLCPDIIIMDIDMPGMNGIETVKKIREYDSDVKIIVLTMHDDKSFLRDSIKEGVNGYLFKMTGMKEAVEAIRSVYNGNEVYGANISKLIGENNSFAENKAEEIPLSRRELEIISLIAEGLTSQEIANKLFISYFTVKNHRKNILQKLNLKNAAELMKYAIEKRAIKK